jgi:sigma-54 dependent transcriptional regulator, acetoin dehydrogenase operon transcriptional activator AcoR
MGADSTITNVTLGRRPEPSATTSEYLVVAVLADDLDAPSSRHRLADIDEVRFGRGPRAAQRRRDGELEVLEIRIPDGRMSTQHGKLIRTPAGWLLDDPQSKNGAVVAGVVTRRQLIADRVVFELGHTFFLLRHAPLETAAPNDATEDELAALAPALATFDGALADRFAALARIAPSEVSILLHGETGTGKEVIANAVHALSRRPGTLVAVNCGALPANLVEAELFGYRKGAFTGAIGERVGLVRSADNGTLFLDEIGELPLPAQATLLRVLQEREVTPVGSDRPVKVDVRLCAATHRDLEALVEAGAFRRDLYARLFGFTLVLPPLRDRIVDLAMIARRLVRAQNTPHPIKLAPATVRALFAYAWPLNIRELEKVLATAIALSPNGVLEPAHLPEAMLAPPRPRTEPPRPAPQAHADDDQLRQSVVQALTLHRGNVNAAARTLNTRRTQLYRWMRRFGIDADAFRG